MTKYKINMVYKFISIILIFLFLMPVTIIYAETPDITENTDNTTEDTDTITDEQGFDYTFINNTKKKALSIFSIDVIEYIRQAYMDSKRVGNYGRLFISKVGIDVALFRKDLEWANETAQNVVDRKDSACVFKYGIQFVIADHKHQGFDGLYNVELGDYAIIKRKNENVEVLICLERCNGINNGNLYKNGVILESLNRGGYSMYTCNENRRHVTMTFWQPVMKDKFENVIPLTVQFVTMKKIIYTNYNKVQNIIHNNQIINK